MKAIGHYALLTPEQEKKLCMKAFKGDKKAHKKLVESNLRLVIKIAGNYKNRGVPLLDLIEEGNLGLMHAIDKFKPQKGFRLSTYATWWIRQNIEHYIMCQSRNIKIPAYTIKKLSKCLKAKEQLTKQQGGMVATGQDIADQVNTSTKQVNRIMNYRLDTTSLDKSVMSDSRSTLKDFIIDQHSQDPLDELCEDELQACMMQWYQTLNKTEKQIIKNRFGFNNAEFKTLDTMAKKMGIAREKIRQIQIKASLRLRKMLIQKGIIDER